MDQEDFELQLVSDDEETRRRENGTDICTPKIKRKKQFRWAPFHELVLLKVVEDELPFQAEKRNTVNRWKVVASIINGAFPEAGVNHLAVRRHFESLIEAFRKDDRKRRAKSGTEEDVKEVDQRLATLSELVQEVEDQAKEAAVIRQKKVDNEKSLGEEIRDAALTTVCKAKGESSSPAPAKRSSEADLIELYEKKEKNKTELKLREFNLKEQHLQLEKEKFDHQKNKEEQELELRKAKFEQEREERNAALATQKLMLEILLKKM